MRIRLVWVGRTKEQFIREGIDKYLKALGHYASVEIVELKDARGKDRQRTVDEESERIRKLDVPYILLDERGSEFSSEEFARFLAAQEGVVTLVTGGAFGVSDSIRRDARKTVSLSRMTFPHELSRLVLLEQLYRACTISLGKGYHH